MCCIDKMRLCDSCSLSPDRVSDYNIIRFITETVATG
jgi:hypothetical protein